MLVLSFTGFDPDRTPTALAAGRQVVKSLVYPLTNPRHFDILRCGPGWQGTECNLIN